MANGVENKKLIEQLQYVMPYILRRREDAQVVDDVMARDVLRVSAGKLRNTGSEARARMKAYDPQVTTEKLSAIEVYAGKLNAQRKYLPQGGAESAFEYESRLNMTPDFYETPGILNDRQGALFSDPPKLEGSDAEKYKPFEQAATIDDKPLGWVIGKVADYMQRHGVCGILADRAPVDKETEDRAAAGDVSEAERQEKRLGRSILAVYSLHQIMDYAFDEKGLTFVKVCEQDDGNRTWSDKGEAGTVYRIIDRVSITTYRVYKDTAGKELVELVGFVSHGAQNTRQEPIVPFFMCASPMDTRHGIGASLLAASAKADVSAIANTSNLMWILFVHAQPLLWARLRSRQDIILGATRFVQLEAANGPGQGPEDIGFAQLDATGVDRLKDTIEWLTRRARELGGKGGDAAVATPTEQSGISRAWQFKTGEERILFLIVTALEQTFNQVLDLVAFQEGLMPENIGIRFNKSFDVDPGKEAIDSAELIIDRAMEFNLPTMVKLALKSMASVLPTPNDEDAAQLEKEIQALDVEAARAAAKPEPVADDAEQEGETDEEADDTGDAE